MLFRSNAKRNDVRLITLGLGSFANYLATATVFPNALQCAEAWDYLSSVLLTIVQRRFTEEEDLAIITSPSICLALLKLLEISVSACGFIVTQTLASG